MKKSSNWVKTTMQFHASVAVYKLFKTLKVSYLQCIFIDWINYFYCKFNTGSTIPFISFCCLLVICKWWSIIHLSWWKPGAILFRVGPSMNEICIWSKKVEIRKCSLYIVTSILIENCSFSLNLMKKLWIFVNFAPICLGHWGFGGKMNQNECP